MGGQRINTAMIEQRNKTLLLVSDITGVDCDAIMGKSRKDKVVTARNLVLWSLCTCFGFTTFNAGILMHKHSTTVSYAVGEINRDNRPQVKQYIELLKIRLNETEIK